MVDLRSQLLVRYKSIQSTSPNPPWAFDIRPSIPFVDPERFEVGRGILIYASAESLAWYPSHGGWPPWLRSDIAWDRHSHWFERWAKDDPGARGGDPFPFFHIEPFSQGGLVLAAAFLATLAGRPIDGDRKEFMRSLAVANFGKFAVDAPTNKDYAGDLKYLEASMPYVLADLEVLRPEVMLITHTTLRTVRRRDREFAKGVRHVVPVMQFQGHNFRRVKEAYGERAASLQEEFAGQPWAKWIPDLDARRRDAIWCYLAEVEQGWKQGRARP